MRPANYNCVILVSGATGRQGGAVARHLLDNAFPVRALTRHRLQPAATDLAALGAQVVEGDLNDRASLDRVLDGVYGVYSVQTFAEAGLEGEVREGKQLADAAKAAGVSHFVYSSVAGANLNSGVPHFETKWRIEQHIRSIGLPYTILRPAFFMENWGQYQRTPILNGVIHEPLDPDKKLFQIAVDDIGITAATAFDNPDGWLGREVDLAGDALTMPQVAEVFGQLLKRNVMYKQVPWDEFSKAVGDEMARLYRWLNDSGYSTDIDALRSEFPHLKTLQQFLIGQGWVREASRMVA